MTSKGTRNANGESSIYLGKDGKWHGRVTMGVRDDGKPDRRHIERKTRPEVVTEVRKLEKERDNGTARKAGPVWTVEKWLTHWLENIAKPTVRYKAFEAYRSAVNVHLIPGLGAHRIDKVQPEHFEKLYKKIVASGRKPGTAHQVHRTARAALNVALARGYINRNAAALARPPRVEEDEIEPYGIDEIQSLITTALGQRNGVRFVIALALGLRQGESLGLKWEQLDKKSRSLHRLKTQLQRRTWEHGCANPHKCGDRLHKVEPCPKSCKKHTRECPPPCPPDCTKHARNCPQRHGGGVVEAPVKSRAGKRGMALPDTIFELLVAHEVMQQAEREHAGTVWEEGGWMFTQPTGKPIDPRRDYEEWKDLVAKAGVRDARLHDARHAAATVLALLNVNHRVTMGLMGWSDPSMPLRYQHMTGAVQRGVADQIEGLLWKPNETETETA
ncbi:MAG TPA: site-specific integrase [Actinocrinis sp.]|nr:site-specific integrase [Actinocrinis sp.]